MSAPAPAEAAEGLRVEGLSVHYRLGGGGMFAQGRVLRAVQDVSFEVRPGETLGVVGESGCGKSSIARALVRLAPVSGGRIFWGGRDLGALDDAAFRRLRPEMQMVFQDPFAALNPRMRVADILAEPLLTHAPRMPAAERRARVLETMARVGLSAEMATRFPHQFSGGQAQRIGIGRAIISHPRLLICDEAVSALDVSVQALILALLKRLQAELGLAIVFISHDLAVVRQVSDRIVVLYLGRVMETAGRDAFFAGPRHPYAQALVASALSPQAGRPASAAPPVEGDIPSPLDPPPGCPFHTRCPRAEARCRAELPALRSLGPGHAAACHFA
jgi:oligopeptide transport system ATP-binding protein